MLELRDLPRGQKGITFENQLEPIKESTLDTSYEERNETTSLASLHPKSELISSMNVDGVRVPKQLWMKT